MTKRFYISDFAGDGITPETAWYPRILTLQASPKIFALEGRPVANVNGPCLIYTDNTDAEHATVIAHPNIKYIPFENTAGDVLALTDTVADINPAKRSAIVSYLETKHIPTQGITLQSTIREAIRELIKRFFLRQNLEELDLSEGLDTQITDIPQAQRQAVAARLQEKGFDTSGLASGTIRQALKVLMDQDIRAMRVNF